jgi:hypothetical protein
MTYMQSNLAFASGIQELSVDEIGFVGGGNWDRFDRNGSSSPWDDAMLVRKSQRDRGICQVANAMQTAGAAAGVVGGLIAGWGLLTGPGAVGAVPIGGAIATAGGATGGAGYLIGKAGGCP